MKRILSFIILLITVGCTQSYEDVDTISTSEEFYATIEVSSADTRTYVDENITTRWHADDRLTIFKKETYNREYKFKGKTGENSGGFTQVSVDDDFYSSETLDKNSEIPLLQVFKMALISNLGLVILINELFLLLKK